MIMFECYDAAKVLITYIRYMYEIHWKNACYMQQQETTLHAGNCVDECETYVSDG